MVETPTGDVTALEALSVQLQTIAMHAIMQTKELVKIGVLLDAQTRVLMALAKRHKDIESALSLPVDSTLDASLEAIQAAIRKLDAVPRSEMVSDDMGAPLGTA